METTTAQRTWRQTRTRHDSNVPTKVVLRHQQRLATSLSQYASAYSKTREPSTTLSEPVMMGGDRRSCRPPCPITSSLKKIFQSRYQLIITICRRIAVIPQKKKSVDWWTSLNSYQQILQIKEMQNWLHYWNGASFSNVPYKSYSVNWWIEDNDDDDDDQIEEKKKRDEEEGHNPHFQQKNYSTEIDGFSAAAVVDMDTLTILKISRFHQSNGYWQARPRRNRVVL